MKRLHRRHVRDRRRSPPSLLWPGTGAVLRGLFVPTIPARRRGHHLDRGADRRHRRHADGAVVRLLAARGRAHERPRICAPAASISAASYFMMALFGIAMVIVGTDRPRSKARARRCSSCCRTGSARSSARPASGCSSSARSARCSAACSASGRRRRICSRSAGALGVRRDAEARRHGARRRIAWFLLVLAVVPMIGLVLQLPRGAEALHLHRRVYFPDCSRSC